MPRGKLMAKLIQQRSVGGAFGGKRSRRMPRPDASNPIFCVTIDERREHGIGAAAWKIEHGVRDHERVLTRGESPVGLRRIILRRDSSGCRPRSVPFEARRQR